MRQRTAAAHFHNITLLAGLAEPFFPQQLPMGLYVGRASNLENRRVVYRTGEARRALADHFQHVEIVIAAIGLDSDETHVSESKRVGLRWQAGRCIEQRLKSPETQLGILVQP